jgi:hypothetical protein
MRIHCPVKDYVNSKDDRDSLCGTSWTYNTCDIEAFDANNFVDCTRHDFMYLEVDDDDFICDACALLHLAEDEP